jgi:phosphopantothenoylcysteine decarboxylase/phosphopantothenate--cysteine ligase
MKKILISAGPTREAIDQVRFITNGSTGRMGYALAAAAAARGHYVRLVSGPVALPPPDGVEMKYVTSAAEMADAILPVFLEFDAVIMTAAVADYRPVRVFDGKLKKTPGNMVLEMERTVDILAAMGAARGGASSPLLIGFAAEYGADESLPQEKLRKKNCDWIAFNDVSLPGAGFGTATNEMILFSASGMRIPLDMADKKDIAVQILHHTGL